MTKDQYLKELQKRLSLLDKDEVNRITDEYLTFFTTKEEQGFEEADIIEQLGNVNQVAKKILEMYHISPRYIKWFIGKEQAIDELNSYTNKIADVSIEVFDKVETTVNHAYKKTVEFSQKSFKNVQNFFSRKKKETPEEKDEEKE